MSYETRLEEWRRDERYVALHRHKEQLVGEVGSWVDTATMLHIDSLAQEEKDDILAMRAEFILDLKGKLGI